MKKLLSILSAIGLTATASSAVVSCAHTFNGHYRADKIVLSGDRVANTDPKDTGIYYISKATMFEAMDDTGIKDIYDNLLKKKPEGKKSIKEMRTILADAAKNEYIEYLATTGVKITKDNFRLPDAPNGFVTKGHTEISAAEIIPDGRTYEIGFYTSDGTGAVAKNASFHWVYLSFAKKTK